MAEGTTNVSSGANNNLQSEQLQAIYDVVVGSIYSYENPKYYFDSIKTDSPIDGDDGRPRVALTLNTDNLTTLYVGSLTYANNTSASGTGCNIYNESGSILQSLGTANITEPTTIDISGNNKIKIELSNRGGASSVYAEMTNVRVY